MATTKKTMTEKKTTAKRTAKPKLTVVKTEEKPMSVFEQMSARFQPMVSDVDLGDGLTVHVVSRLPLQSVIALIKRITDVCVDEERGEVHFHMLDFTAKLFIVSAYCGIEVPEDVEVGYAATCRAGGLYELVSSHIDTDQLEMIWNSCEDIMSGKAELFNSAAAKLTIDIVQRINELYEMISNVTDHFDGEEAVEALRQFSTIAGK